MRKQTKAGIALLTLSLLMPVGAPFVVAWLAGMALVGLGLGLGRQR